MKGRIMKMLRAFIGRIAEAFFQRNEHACNNLIGDSRGYNRRRLDGMCNQILIRWNFSCIDITYFDKHPYVPEETPVVVDIPLEDPEPEPD